MSYLQEMPLDELKIDRRFTARIESTASGRAIVAAIADLAHALDLEVVAEGVEDESVLDVLDAIGCETAQGYHLCRPCRPTTCWPGSRPPSRPSHT
jgi:EAL domain-containing protein (putative c-di-GMP-specific phosphodiesterase class I)